MKMTVQITGMGKSGIGGSMPEEGHEAWQEFNRTSDRDGWIGRGSTHELPADGVWAGGNGGDADTDDDPAKHLYKHASSGRIVGPEGLCDKGNDDK